MISSGVPLSSSRTKMVLLVQAGVEEAAGLREQVRAVVARLDAGAREVRQREEELSLRGTQLEVAQRAASERKKALDEELEKAQRERTKRVRIEEENKVSESREDGGEGVHRGW